VVGVLTSEDTHVIGGALVALRSLQQDMGVVAELDWADVIMSTAVATQPDVAVLEIGLPRPRSPAKTTVRSGFGAAPSRRWLPAMEPLGY
jgi:hypothetical protein